MKATSIIWRRTFPESEPGTDGVAIFEGRIIGRVRLLAERAQDSKTWMWTITDPDLAAGQGWANTHGQMPSRRRQAWGLAGPPYSNPVSRGSGARSCCSRRTHIHVANPEPRRETPALPNRRRRHRPRQRYRARPRRGPVPCARYSDDR